MSVVLRPDQSLVSEDRVIRVYSRMLEQLDTPISLGIYLQLKHRHFDDVASRSVVPSNYACPQQFLKDYQAISGLRKAAFLKTSFDKRANALKKFWESEKSCTETNLRFDHLMYDGGLQELLRDDPEIAMMLFKAQALISRILRKLPKSFDYRFGPGATSLVKRGITLPEKYSHEIHVTPELYPYWRDIVGPTWARSINNVVIVPGNAVTFVPKDSRVDRPIAIEPHLNIYAQLGVGSVLRQRLSAWIDLNKGQDHNRFLVSQAHSWGLSTIDFSSASDTISRSVVAFLLPEEWWSLLDSLRSHRFSLNGEIHENQKFSSMGNGFTFELESLIFYALARAAGGSRFFTSAYGDDVIIEREFADNFVRLSEFCGFHVNREKSFLDGSFFESCGADYFDDVDVRPFFWKELKPTFVFKMSNDIQRLALKLNCKKLQHLRDQVVNSFPSEVRRCLIPQGYGDVGFIVEWDFAKPSLRTARNGYCGFITKAMKYQSMQEDYRSSLKGYLAALDTMSEVSASPIRGRGVYMLRPFVTFGSWTGLGRVS